MGSLCCSPCGDELEELTFSSNSIHRQCGCIRCFFQQLLIGYNAMFHRLEGRPVPTQLQEAVSLTDNPLSDHRYAGLRRDGLIFRRDKSMTNLQEASQPLRRNKSSSSVESLAYGKKSYSVDPEEEADRASAMKFQQRLVFLQPSSEDEDVCPTCLDEYTPENPKIMTRCSHHFHLGCIYEWLERSNCCPICGKEMEFNVTP